MKLPFVIKINFVSVYQLIRRYLLKKKNMCFSKLWGKLNPKPEPPSVTEKPTKTALFFAVNNYPGNGNDLNGCINDQLDWVARLISAFPGFTIRQFTDNQATPKAFISEVTKAIINLMPGDVLFVHYSGHGTQVFDKHGDEADGYDEGICLISEDGRRIDTVIDDDIGSALRNIVDGATVFLAFDSCFSDTVTRDLRNKNKRIKFIRVRDAKARKVKRRRFKKEEMKWIVMSGCGEQQTSADAYINRKYNGAFTYFALKALSPGMTYRQWHEKIRTYLPSKDYDQIPMLEGNESLFDKQVFT
jgi:metacaspase-1